MSDISSRLRSALDDQEGGVSDNHRNVILGAFVREHRDEILQAMGPSAPPALAPRAKKERPPPGPVVDEQEPVAASD